MVSDADAERCESRCRGKLPSQPGGGGHRGVAPSLRHNRLPNGGRVTVLDVVVDQARVPRRPVETFSQILKKTDASNAPIVTRTIAKPSAVCGRWATASTSFRAGVVVVMANLIAMGCYTRPEGYNRLKSWFLETIGPPLAKPFSPHP